jgi:predicted DNA-binding transcriptional regulator AlpA
MPKKKHQDEVILSAKTSGSGAPSSCGRRGSKISENAQPWAADGDFTTRRRVDLLCATALPNSAGVAAGLRSRESLRPEKPDAFRVQKSDGCEFIPAPKLRAKLGISAVTLWRWRHDKENRFPAPTVINGRLYFALGSVVAWLARQADAA